MSIKEEMLYMYVLIKSKFYQEYTEHVKQLYNQSEVKNAVIWLLNSCGDNYDNAANFLQQQLVESKADEQVVFDMLRKFLLDGYKSKKFSLTDLYEHCGTIAVSTRCGGNPDYQNCVCNENPQKFYDMCQFYDEYIEFGNDEALDKELLKFLKTGKSGLVEDSQDECFQEDEYPTDQIYKQRTKDLVENYKHQRTKRKVGIVFAKIALVLLYAISGFVGLVIVASWFL